jgi:hypothetical protein
VVVKKTPRVLLLIAFSALSASTQEREGRKWTAKNPPKFDDFPASEWHGTAAPIKLTTRSERMFRTNLTNASKEPPNFAGHYRITGWGCGSACGAGALVDLQTGDVFPLPLASQNGRGWEKWIDCPRLLFKGPGDEFRLGSRLMIARCGAYAPEPLDIPDTHYFVWENGRFRQLLFIASQRSER